ncbi:hypothetical protein ENC19_00805 [Verrucosispora sp. CWR15]|uniref:Uncharacterized protein n=1 Tax=Verrucosispora sioxanthis TaxID=2499994 RepID=A0A6M1KTD8_9ACTN|nr:hypothetical protein [Verrucosispora sioxanthis]NEE62209.1 hypothetical protein [Verrucosispora sioxanthis]NGM11319.1 hypothetical protein [Verrucosispora sioxanthis]
MVGWLISRRRRAATEEIDRSVLDEERPGERPAAGTVEVRTPGDGRTPPVRQVRPRCRFRRGRGGRAALSGGRRRVRQPAR